MRTIEAIAQDAFNGIPIPQPEQDTFIKAYGADVALAYGITAAQVPVPPAGPAETTEESPKVVEPAVEPVVAPAPAPAPAPAAPVAPAAPPKPVVKPAPKPVPAPAPATAPKEGKK